jgi:glycosyltransferase involved in cell wall biosynthesis
MHILLIHQAFVGLDEAGGTRHIEMARQLTSHGHKVTIITGTTSYLTGVKRQPGPGRKLVDQPAPDITVIHTWSYAALHKGFLNRLVSFFSFMMSSFLAGLQVRRVDVVWGTSPPIFQAFSAWLLSFLKGVPFLFEVRDLWPDFAIAMGILQNRTLIALSKWLERFLYKRAERVVVNSPGYVEHVKTHGARAVSLVPNGVDAAMFSSPRDNSTARAYASAPGDVQKYGLENKFVVMYAGAHGPSNDLGVLIEAAALLQDDPAIHIILVGDGKDKPALMADAQARGLDNVTFIDPVAKNEMKGMFALADVCLAILKPIELYKTTYPNKVFDYMAAGRPVLLAIDGVIRQVVEEAKGGLFVPPGDARALADAIRALSQNPAQAKQMGINGQRYVREHFDRARFTNRFEQILWELVEK